MNKNTVNLAHLARLSDCIHGNSLRMIRAEWYEEWKDGYSSPSRIEPANRPIYVGGFPFTCQTPACEGRRSSATIDTEKSTKITMPKSDHKAALVAIEKILALLRSVQTLEGTDKDGVEHLLEMALENLKN